MPLLNCLDESMLCAGMAEFQLFTIMAYPTDEVSRAEFLDVLQAWLVELSRRPNHPVVWLRQPSPADFMQLLRRRDQGPAAQDVWRRAGDAYAKGSVAGEALMLIRQLTVHGPNRGSVNRACHILAEAGKASKWTSGCWPIPFRNPTSLRDKAWTPYKSVAHFWTAFNILVQERFQDGQGQPVEYPIQQPLHDPEDFIILLTVAEEYRRFGETHIPHGQKIATLSPHETWQVPPDIALPPFTASIPPITTSWYLQAMSTYTA